MTPSVESTLGCFTDDSPISACAEGFLADVGPARPARPSLAAGPPGDNNITAVRCPLSFSSSCACSASRRDSAYALFPGSSSCSGVSAVKGAPRVSSLLSSSSFSSKSSPKRFHNGSGNA
ncbi:unnamed protein product [Prorocentrum cordatum]|uniref:Uncharacterized protein n=1 Tax=Prorocentrum cordatum TaxID=2364126 RepID=A0ABN9V4Y6_9DINO|nr:unnamed protein product [Polarella glacialis]